MLDHYGSGRGRYAALKTFGLTMLAVVAVSSLVAFYALLLWLGFVGARALLGLF